MLLQKIKLVLLLICLHTFAQAQGIQDMANTIIITLKDSTTARDKAIKTFSSLGYTVKNPSKVTKNVSTDAKTLKNKTRVGFNAEIKGAEVVLTGKILFAGQEGIVIQHKGEKGTHALNAWDEMEKIAKAFGGSLAYLKR